MLSRHMNELMTRLDRAGEIGCAEIRKNELLLWYGRDRMTKGIWADIYEKWNELEIDSPLLVGDSDGVWVLAYGEGLTVTADAWFKDVRQLAGLTIPKEDPPVTA